MSTFVNPRCAGAHTRRIPCRALLPRSRPFAASAPWGQGTPGCRAFQATTEQVRCLLPRMRARWSIPTVCRTRAIEGNGERALENSRLGPCRLRDPGKAPPLDSQWTLPSPDSPLIDLRGCLDRPFPGL